MKLIDWAEVDTILLDMDGTLLDLAFDNHFWKQAIPTIYAEDKGISLEQSQQHLGQYYEAYSGTLEWYCTDFWSEKLGLDIIKHKTDMAHKIALRPGTEAFLTEAKASAKKVVLVTNAHPETLRVKLETTAIDQYFDQLYTSHQFNQPKESPLFWSQLEAELEASLSRCLFIDDTESILIQAQQSGVKYSVMVKQPDLSLPEREATHMLSVNQLTELLPIK
ncbi:GMP/IMP nucleotidase [Kangiella marina]|uniref:GMP/IMP nucleotidase n=1 Tax=Kangiella marina TaxID=1079178 RepID=A0ABP8IHB5_9GAMM